MENLYNELKSGRSADEIVAEFTKNLNDAENRIKAEYKAQEAAEKAARAAEKTRNQKREDFAEAVGLFLAAIGTHYPDLGLDVEDITDEVCYALADMAIMAIDLELVKSTGILGSFPKVKVHVDKAPTKENDPFAAFFKQFGL